MKKKKIKENKNIDLKVKTTTLNDGSICIAIFSHKMHVFKSGGKCYLI